MFIEGVWVVGLEVWTEEECERSEGKEGKRELQRRSVENRRNWRRLYQRANLAMKLYDQPRFYTSQKLNREIITIPKIKTPEFRRSRGVSKLKILEADTPLSTQASESDPRWKRKWDVSRFMKIGKERVQRYEILSENAKLSSFSPSPSMAEQIPLITLDNVLGDSILGLQRSKGQPRTTSKSEE